MHCVESPSVVRQLRCFRRRRGNLSRRPKVLRRRRKTRKFAMLRACGPQVNPAGSHGPLHGICDRSPVADAPSERACASSHAPSGGSASSHPCTKNLGADSWTMIQTRRGERALTSGRFRTGRGDDPNCCVRMPAFAGGGAAWHRRALRARARARALGRTPYDGGASAPRHTARARARAVVGRAEGRRVRWVRVGGGGGFASV